MSGAPTPPGDDGGPTLEAILVAEAAALARFVRREGAGLLRFESAEDLVQGVQMRALAAPHRFEFRGAEQLRGWLFTLARRHIADRRDYWSAMKRGSGRVLRLTFGGSASGDPMAARAPAAPGSGPSTIASKRELLVLAARAIAILPPRDRQLVKWMSESVALDEQASRLGISYEATQRAGLRAVERFKKAWRLVTERGGPAPGA